ncbi:MAG: toll/interleukin-1 receptor domain-containing protein [Candidatus Limisoma sp.]
MARVFISYKRVDEIKVFKIKEKLQSVIGEKFWIDYDGIESDAIFKSVIIRAINESEIFLFMYSKAHSQILDYENDWTIRELSFAKLKKKRIVFVNIDGSPLSDHFLFDYGNKQQVDATSPQALDHLCTDLQKWLGCATPNANRSTIPATRKTKTDQEESISLSKIVDIGHDYYFGTNGKRQDYAEAVKLYRQAAEQGDAKGQYNLGYCYYYGFGVGRDRTKATDWFRKSAKQGYIEAQESLSVCYNGYSVGSNSVDAVKCYIKAAEQGHSYAQNILGSYYESGYGIAKDYHEAAKWYRKAAEQGNADAQYHLGYCYEQGQGISKNLDEAVKWYQKAAEQGDTEAKARLITLGFIF